MKYILLLLSRHFHHPLSQVPPFRFTYTGDRKRRAKPLTPAQQRANAIADKERSKREWEKKKEIQRLENPIAYEIIPASTPGFVHLHRVAATRGVITSDTWETVPEDHVKVELYRVRMADNPSPLPNYLPLKNSLEVSNEPPPPETPSDAIGNLPSNHSNDDTQAPMVPHSDFKLSSASSSCSARYSCSTPDADAMDMDVDME